jgi:hypothetical protein
MNYQYWNDFVNDWVHGNYSKSSSGTLMIGGWQKPNICMAAYLPEPWWDNDDSTANNPLYSVVVNFNPGEGGPKQEFGNQQFLPIQNALSAGRTYQDLMHQVLPTHLSKTQTWHQNRRAKPMIEALRLLQNAQLCPANDEIKHHLSVELIPWHTPNTSSKQFNDYVKNNAKAIVDNSIAFAAAQSLRIPKNIQTHGKVIMRMCWSEVNGILTNAGVTPNLQPASQQSIGNGWQLVKFTIPQFPNVSFRCLWIEHGFNNMPQTGVLVNAIR